MKDTNKEKCQCRCVCNEERYQRGQTLDAECPHCSPITGNPGKRDTNKEKCNICLHDTFIDWCQCTCHIRGNRNAQSSYADKPQCSPKEEKKLEKWCTLDCHRTHEDHGYHCEFFTKLPESVAENTEKKHHPSEEEQERLKGIIRQKYSHKGDVEGCCKEEKKAKCCYYNEDCPICPKVVSVNTEDNKEWEEIVDKFEALKPDTREWLKSFIASVVEEERKRGISIAMHHVTKHTQPIHDNCELCNAEFEYLNTKE